MGTILALIWIIKRFLWEHEIDAHKHRKSFKLT
ncbi:hypothetical protein SEA_NICEHOUSE_40 [Rhodococcus phage NiceHouse]|nr:hypothetical protein SEA_NICEHOUSE_40 [Rhodococcus phage NiceHouse]